MKKKPFETLLFSSAGVAAMCLALIAGNYIASWFKTRMDLTAEKAYTLSDGTKAILSKLDSTVTLRFYCTREENAMPVPLKVYARQVEDLLDEYKQAARGKIIVEKLDPRPDSDAEDSANLDGVEGQMLQTGEKVYLGVAVSLLNERAALPFLSPDRERLLEYDLSRAIARVVNPEMPVIGIMTPLQVMGTPQAMQRFGQQPRDPWVFISELKKDFTVRNVMMTAEKIDDDIKVLLLVHPKDIGDIPQYAIDQFIMRGGKLIAFLDPNCYFDDQKQNPMMGGGMSQSGLDKLLKAWGIEYDTGKAVADMTFATQIRQQDGRVADAPAVLRINKEGINGDDIVTSQIGEMMLAFSGAFQGTPKDGLKKTVLLKTTKNSSLVDGFLAALPGDAISKEFKAGDKELELAVRLTGKFKTAFPDGKPKTAEKADDKDKKTEDKAADSLKETAGENTVILVADADMLNDAVSVQVQNFFGQKIIIPQNGNLNFVQALAEQMAGDSNLISVRSRATQNRPFTLVKKMEARAQEQFRERIRQLEEAAQEANRKINELQRNKSKEQRFILSPEQQKELENLRKKEGETNKELKQVKKDFRKEIDSLETTVKWINILAMPLVVSFFGIALAVVKRKRTAAK